MAASKIGGWHMVTGVSRKAHKTHTEKTGNCAGVLTVVTVQVLYPEISEKHRKPRSNIIKQKSENREADRRLKQFKVSKTTRFQNPERQSLTYNTSGIDFHLSIIWSK